jgi:glycerophosphoryl diester phosphodiesterase
LEQSVQPSDNPFRIGRPLVIPHAGGDGLFPENTIFAYEQSRAIGGDVIDADVFLTADGIPVAFHDSTLDRTTNGNGRVQDHTYAELATLDAGWDFERQGEFPFRGQGIGIPTIESVLTAFPDMLITLDLKDQRIDVVDPLCSLMRRLGTETVYVGIDTDQQVERFREVCPEVRTSGTDAERQAMRVAREANDTNFATNQLVSQPRFRADDGTPRVTPETLAFSHSLDIAVLTYVVDDPDDMADLIEMGIDGIYTRRPDLLVALLTELDLW